ncbi:beta-N-acetylhexosaminidase [Zooshikella marina]|uniref:beta-N-acetylhexosaminidase n=1 Tax=Zooshikella ganghwensis TaxID=202772 RepID=A0A4P9VPD5_9GAMM|nr:beta-N-acetylhexosaminidase [Zooshikella ganghwensis]MBU2705240.1 beta-N-acetylhexosaminidase [Zooshikella ganghwensis]RDH44367.1 beta-N-acetylhexosaminidase [Zooshikella ganghwensis]
MRSGPFVIDIAGTQLTEEDVQLLHDNRVGGLILFSRNYQHRQQLVDLIQQVRALRPDLLIMTDQEGGRVQRFKAEFTRIPAMGRLVKAAQHENIEVPALLRDVGWLLASELLACGIDLTLAPVVDLDRGISTVVGDRAFAEDPQCVVEYAGAFIEGLTAAGMSACIKHFPGHGGVAEDSHHHQVVDERTFEDIMSTDGLTFKTFIRQGIPAVMASHVVFPKVAAEPTGFSHYWLTTILREKLGFKGVILSDDLSMQGASWLNGSAVAQAQAALDAGCDLLLVCNQRAKVLQLLQQTAFAQLDCGNQIRTLRANNYVDFDQLQKDARWVETRARLMRWSYD